MIYFNVYCFLLYCLNSLMKLALNDTFLPQKVKNNYRASTKYVPYTVTLRHH